MIVLGELLVAFAWTFGANGFLIERHLSGSALPAAWVEPVAGRARVVFHDRGDWAMAFHQPGEKPAGEPARLFLFAPYYLAPDGLTPASRMPVDVAEYYFHALLEAALDLRIAGDPAWATRVERRAAATMSEVPETERRGAYLAALADFGAHALAIANEIERAAVRQRAAGRDVCRLIASPASLFALWAASLDSAPYRGRYRDPRPGAAPVWTTSRQALARRDKELLAREVLGVAWSGVPARDFAALCPGAARPGSAAERDPADGG